MNENTKKDEMYKEKQRSDSEIIAMVTLAGITYEEEDGTQIFYEVVAAFPDDESGKIYFVCAEENSDSDELAFFYHLAGEVNAVEEDAEFDLVAQLYEEWSAQLQ
ncbi:MAG: DUF1292 domain-containing protein [Ruminococcaceae bacterium]|nr:DUF1292 domain-containing protein [Oscillospiraceae bacterium]